MRLYVLRHGLAGNPDEWQADDAERPLTRRGKKKMRREAKRLRKLGIMPELILTSPLVRAHQTAEIVADYLDIKLALDNRLSPGFAIDCLAEILQERHNIGELMLVGHEPDFSETIGSVIGGGCVILKKGGIACIDLQDPALLQGELVWLLTPKTLLG